MSSDISIKYFPNDKKQLYVVPMSYGKAGSEQNLDLSPSSPYHKCNGLIYSACRGVSSNAKGMLK